MSSLNRAKSSLRWALVSPGEMRLRAAWRILIQWGLVRVFDWALGLFPPAAYFNNQDFKTLVAMVLSIYLARRLLDRRSFISLGVQPGWRLPLDLLAGFIIAAAMVGLILYLERRAGWVAIRGFTWQFEPLDRVGRKTFYWLLTYLFIAVQEELSYRGYQLQNIKEGLNLTWAFLISSLWFGISHSGDPGATWRAALGIAAIGLLFAFACLRTGHLWLPIGLHLGWNFFLGPVGGFSVSGYVAYHLALLRFSGPAAFTGGDFGPEAGLLLMPALLLGTAAVWLYTLFTNKRKDVRLT